MTDRPTIGELERAIGLRHEDWPGHCHEVSLAIVRSGIFPVARVARGSGSHIVSQHSWIVLGDDCYADVELCDPTMFPGRVWYGTYRDGLHRPHGAGTIWDYGRPATAEEESAEPYRPPGYDELSVHAKSFLRAIGELSERGWRELAHYPVGGWPAGEIITMICEDPKLRAAVPIDIEGMVTDRNPAGLYLRENTQVDL